VLKKNGCRLSLLEEEKIMGAKKMRPSEGIRNPGSFQTATIVYDATAVF